MRKITSAPETLDLTGSISAHPLVINVGESLDLTGSIRAHPLVISVGDLKRYHDDERNEQPDPASSST